MRQPLGLSVHISRDCINIATERMCVYLDYNRIQTATGCISLFLIGLYWHYHLVYVYVNWRQWYWHSYWHYISWDCINVAKGSMCIIYICIYICIYIYIYIYIYIDYFGMSDYSWTAFIMVTGEQLPLGAHYWHNYIWIAWTTFSWFLF